MQKNTWGNRSFTDVTFESSYFHSVPFEHGANHGFMAGSSVHSNQNAASRSQTRVGKLKNASVLAATLPSLCNVTFRYDLGTLIGPKFESIFI